MHSIINSRKPRVSCVLSSIEFDKNKEPFKFALGNILAGGAAGFTSCLLFYPLDFARTRLTVDVGKSCSDRQFANVFDLYRQIFQSDGIRGIYRGLGLTLALTALYRSTYFGLYDTGKAYLFPDNKKQSFFAMWAFGT